MKKLILLLPLLVLLSGCSAYFPDDKEIIEKDRYCQSQGLKTKLVKDILGQIHSVKCDVDELTK